ncbi:MAG: FHA domain-containing protein [Limisphaerales bacterium]
MPALIFTSVDGQRTELPLKPGINRLGRVDGNDILVPDDSVAESHCEVSVEGTNVLVRDLGSATGTAVNGTSVQEGTILPGETLRVGNVEFLFQDDSPMGALRIDGAIAAQAAPSGPVCRTHPMLPAKWQCSKCGELACDTCVLDGRAMGVPGVKFCRSCKSVAAKVGAGPSGHGKSSGGKTFAGEMAAAWAYPFRREGSIIMVTGAIFFAIAAFAQNFLFLIGLMVYVFTTGYWMAYAQKIVQASAQGEEDPPTWPDVSDFYSDIIQPFLQAAALFIVYLLPVFVPIFMAITQEEPMYYLGAAALGLVSVFMMPMAWLAISMHESVMGLSPHVVIPSILRIPGHYMLIVVELVILVCINIGLELLFDKFRIPIVTSLITSFLGVYFMMVICRLLGSLYFLNRHRLGWF